MKHLVLVSIASLSLLACGESRAVRLASREASREYREMEYKHDLELAFREELRAGPVLTCPEMRNDGTVYGVPAYAWERSCR